MWGPILTFKHSFDVASLHPRPGHSLLTQRLLTLIFTMQT